MRLASLLVLGATLMTQSTAFLMQPSTIRPSRRLYSSFVGDGSDYSSKESDFDDEDDLKMDGIPGGYRRGGETPTIELSPVPMSKNSGNRFVAFVWDQDLDTEGRNVLDLHYDRIRHTEDHVLFCRKRNLYNETFNNDSMVDILWSYPMYVVLVGFVLFDVLLLTTLC